MASNRYILILLLFFSIKSFGQIGGESTYQFLELTNSARVAALGGNQIAINDSSDLNLPYHNPSLLTAGMKGQFLVNYVNYFADVKYGYASYSPTLDIPGNVAFGMHYINYGKFREATEDGSLTGNTFKAAEYALNLIYSNQYKRWHYGINLKPVLSIFESYQSVGLVADLGISISSKKGLTTVAFVARNIGGQITPYYKNGHIEQVPFDLQFGVSKRLEHAPLVLFLTAQHLNHWDLANLEADKNSETDEYSFYGPTESLGKQLMRHIVFGIELLPSDNFTIRAGYNYQRRQELVFGEKNSTVGFSLGFGFKVKRFRFDFGTSRFHLAGSYNLFSMAINLSENF